METLRLIFIACAIFSFVPAQSQRAVYFKNSSIVVANDPLDDVFFKDHADTLAKASYTRSDSGDWNLLRIETTESSPEAYYAAGFLEGRLSYLEIFNTFVNTYGDWFDTPDGPEPEPIFRFLRQNYLWVLNQVQLHSTSSAYWRHVGLIIQQLQGLLDGYNSVSLSGKVQKIPIENLLFINADGDMESLTEFLPQRTSKRRHAELRCSAIFKLAPGNTDLLFAHATWDHYTLMCRTLKSYNFSNSVTVLSSSPGFLSSVDDFFITSNGLAIMETTNGNHNSELWTRVTPKSLLSWMRALVANHMGTTAPQWVELFSSFNSGTYNNQWMVFDTKLFKPGRPLPKDAFWVLEQLPGLVVADDQTASLQAKSYWSSYNIPFYEQIYNLSNFPQLRPKWKFSYSKGPRAKIFEREQRTIKTLSDLKRVIRYNNYVNDTFSRDDACNQIAARCDLNLDSEYRLSGAIDAKVSSISLIKEKGLGFFAQQGPTHDDQRPFSWDDFHPSAEYPTVPKHAGQAKKAFVFDWIFFVSGKRD